MAIAFLVVVIFALFLGLRASRAMGCVGLPLGLLLLVIVASLKTWRSAVIVDDRGVTWRGNGTGGALPWEALQRIDYDRAQRVLVVGLVERGTDRFHPLPFITSDLYAALKSRLGPGPSEIEGECLAR